MTFAEKLRKLRDEAGLSEAKLAKRSGVSFAAIHDYGLGRRKPSLSAAVKIAQALGVTCEAFADCEDVLSDGKTSDKGAAPKSSARSAKATPSTPPAEDLEATEKKPGNRRGKR